MLRGTASGRAPGRLLSDCQDAMSPCCLSRPDQIDRHVERESIHSIYLSVYLSILRSRCSLPNRLFSLAVCLHNSPYLSLSRVSRAQIDRHRERANLSIYLLSIYLAVLLFSVTISFLSLSVSITLPTSFYLSLSHPSPQVCAGGQSDRHG